MIHPPLVFPGYANICVNWGQKRFHRIGFGGYEKWDSWWAKKAKKMQIFIFSTRVLYYKTFYGRNLQIFI